MTVHREIAFEHAIERAMHDAGWRPGQPAHYRCELGLDTAMLMEFFGATQAQQWDKLVAYSGGDPDAAQRTFAERLAKEIDDRGAVDVLRHGVKDRGLLFRLAYFRPAHTLADDALVQYEQNRLSVTRQLHYSVKEPDRSLDLVLFINGVPVATAELKNPLTGQTVEHAKEQYRRDRDPRELLFARRTLVHFAVDPELVFITTRLAGSATRFLPFNTGSEGPGVDGGAGNPPAGGTGYRTSYLWEQVWQPEAWLDLIRRFLHVENADGDGRRRSVHDKPMIFPRYHQWHAVRTLTEHAATCGSGPNYLVQPCGIGEVQHHRVAGPPAVEPAQRRERAGLRQGRG